MYDEVIFQVSIKNPEEMVRELDSAEIDFAITVETLPERFRFEEKLVEDEMVLIGPENHPLVGKTRILPIELSRYPFVLVGSSTEKPGFADTFFHNIGIAPSSLKIVMITESQDLAIKMIRLEKIPITAAAKAFLQFTRNYSFFVPF